MAKKVAILGAGIMGTTLAIYLARGGFRVFLFDEASVPMAGASRWNEGKIHLGYIYARDDSLGTAKRIIPGGLMFAPLIEEMIETSIRDWVSDHDDTFLIHKESIVDADMAEAYYRSVGQLIGSHPQASSYLCDLTNPVSRKLSRAEIAVLADGESIVAGFTAPERSVQTTKIADKLVEVLISHPSISLCLGTCVIGARALDLPNGAWRLELAEHPDESFDLVVNALGSGRLGIDLVAGLIPPPGWSHRFRLSLFVQTKHRFSMPSATIAVGPFGDMKNYDGYNFYISWYPAGLRVESEALVPPNPAQLDETEKNRLISTVYRELGHFIPSVCDIDAATESVAVEGGFIFAMGHGSIGDPNASIHRRDRFGVSRNGNYISIDTGKYSVAPLTAKILSEQLIGD